MSAHDQIKAELDAKEPAQAIWLSREVALAVRLEHDLLRAATPQWQDISTAPKDGRAILVHHWGAQSVARWVDDYTDPQDDKNYDGVWMIFPCDDDPYYAHWTVAATHWQPLPSPPEQPK